MRFWTFILQTQKINLGRLISNDWTILLQGNEESKENWKESKNRWFLPFSRLANDQNIEEIMFTLSLFSHIFYRELEIFERMKWKKFNSKWFDKIRFLNLNYFRKIIKEMKNSFRDRNVRIKWVEPNILWAVSRINL